MSEIHMDETRIKELFKEAVEEVLEERINLFYDVFAEVVEDFGMVKAIEEVRSSERVSREEVFRTLQENE